MLIITNGDSAAGAIRAAGIPGAVLPWRDVLHDGPVPAGLSLADMSEVRARFIASCGWGEAAAIRADFQQRDARLSAFAQHAEVVLWFEHDLYDQLQLLQLLHWFDGRELGATRLSLICDAAFIAEQPLEKLPDRFVAREPVTGAQLRLGHRAWEAFCAPTPTGLQALLSDDTHDLLFIKAAFTRLLEEYPSAQNGLSRSERQILQVAQAGGVQRVVDLFQAVQPLEAARYLGDGSFRRYLAALINVPDPLLHRLGGGPFAYPQPPFPDRRFAAQRVELTALGEAVLANQTDWIETNGLDKWIGGVHLRRGNIWRWDGEKAIGDW